MKLIFSLLILVLPSLLLSQEEKTQKTTYGVFLGLNKNAKLDYQAYLENSQNLYMFSNYSFSIGLITKTSLRNNFFLKSGIEFSTINSSQISDIDSANYSLQNEKRREIWFGRNFSSYFQIPITLNKTLLKRKEHHVLIGSGIGLVYLMDFKKEKTSFNQKNDQTNFEIETKLQNPKNFYLGLLTQVSYSFKPDSSKKSYGISFINFLSSGNAAIGSYTYQSNQNQSSGILVQRFNYFRIQAEISF